MAAPSPTGVRVPQLILHHYPSSPFSEKIRAILGFKGLRWSSVVIPVIMPKPDAVALTGGYRKTPFLQIGSDIYCDSALIADVLERLAPTPSLHPPESAGLARIVAQWADSALFGAAVGHIFQPAGVQSLFGHLPPEHIKAFLADRAALSAGASSPGMNPQEATGALRLYLQQLDTRLADGRPWLFGPAPSLADFSVYHCLWFVQQVKAVSGILDESPHVKHFLDRFQTFSQGASEQLSSTEAIAIAARGRPEPLADEPFVDAQQGLAKGARVKVSATDYGKDPVEGEFVLSRPNELAIRRTDARAGELVVHFPRLGFQVRAAE
ncbi:glutathione S-transferase family protein [Cystobacter fuscus]|nr:glutathione S-transferase family protein [Cystobacter fuscus]